MAPAQRNAFTAELQAAGVDWRPTVYGGALHAFRHPPVGHPVVPGVGYHPQHAQRAWRDVVDLLTEPARDGGSAGMTRADMPGRLRRAPTGPPIRSGGQA